MRRKRTKARGFAFACIALLGAFLLGACQKKEASLSLLVWEGYADPSFIHAFEEAHHCKISASYMGSSDDLVAKLRGGSAGNYDVISPSSDVAASIVQAGLAEPLDLSKLPTYSQLSPKLREMPLVKANGQTFGVPFMWGPNPLLYDTTVFAQGSGFLGDFLGPEIQRQNFRLGRFVHVVYGRADVGL